MNLDTIKVIEKDTGRIRIINLCDFSKEKHEIFSEKPKVPEVAEVAEVAEVKQRKRKQ